MQAAIVLEWVVGVYFAMGIAFGVAFVLRGIEVVDAAARHAPWSFRMLVLPGVVALWPILARRRMNAGAASSGTSHP